MIQLGQQTEQDVTLPPLQRVGLTELSLIGVLWGNYGYTAMVQTPDGKGYSIRRGTRIGPNNGVVSSITERGIIVQERFTDGYGNKQEREYVKLLHPKEGNEACTGWCTSAAECHCDGRSVGACRICASRGARRDDRTDRIHAGH